MRTIGRKCVQRALTITEDENRDRWSEKALKMRTVGQKSSPRRASGTQSVNPSSEKRPKTATVGQKRSYWPQLFSAGGGGRQNTSRSQSLAFSLLLVKFPPRRHHSIRPYLWPCWILPLHLPGALLFARPKGALRLSARLIGGGC